MYRITQMWNVGEYELFEVKMHKTDEIYYGFTIGDAGKKNNELYLTLDKALIAAVGEKHTGRRGAGGTGVGTAADWFAKMIGLEPIND